LTDANNIVIAGTHAYVTTGHGLVIIDIDDPLNPKIVNQIGEPGLKHPRALAIQFRYGFVVDEEGLKVIDLTAPDHARLVEGAMVPLSSLATAERKVGPIAINHAGQLQAITVSFNLAPGTSLSPRLTRRMPGGRA
jgi:hypothetical protein